MKFSWLIALVLVVPLAAMAAETSEVPQPPEQAPQTEIEQQHELEQARRALQEAAAHVAALSMNLFNREFQHGLRRVNMSVGWARLGINLGEPIRGGLAVQAVTPGGAADQAGIRAGDTLQTIAGLDLGGRDGNRHKLARVLDVLEPGGQVEVSWTHAGETHHAMLKARDLFASLRHWAERESDLAEHHAEIAARKARAAARRTANAAQSAAAGFTDFGDWNAWFGWPGRWNNMELTTLTPQLGQYFGAREGLLVVRAPDDAALKLNDGDVILKIGERSPGSPTQAMRILRTYMPGDTLKLTVMRDHERRTLTVKLPEEHGEKED